MSVLRLTRYITPPDLDPDEDITHGDEKHRQDVAEDEIANDEVEDLAEGVGPDVEAELDVRVVLEDRDQVEGEHPGDGDEDGEDPDEHDHEPCAPLRDLALQRPPDRQEPVNK